MDISKSIEVIPVKISKSDVEGCVSLQNHDKNIFIGGINKIYSILCRCYVFGIKI